MTVTTIYYFDIETTGLNPYKDKILTIQLKKNNEFTMLKTWEEDEKHVLTGFFDLFRNVGKSSILGYNCLQFDLSFIVSRMNKHGIMNAEKHAVLHNGNWLDLYQYLGGNYVSMDHWLQSCGIRRECQYKGRDVPTLYEKKMYKEIERHTKDDLVMCERLAEIVRTKR